MERLREAVTLAGGVDATSKITGKTTAQLYRYLNGNHVPGLMPLAVLANHVGLSLNWLATGFGPRSIKNEPLDDKGFTLLTLGEQGYDLGIGSGFLRGWNLNAKSLVAASADHDGMAPTVQKGDMLLLDTSVNRFSPGIFSIEIQEQAFVTRVTITPDKLRFSFDNKAYQGFDIDLADSGKVTCVARVVWVGHRL